VPNTNSTGTLQAILHYIDLHYQQPLTREEIAKAVGYSPSHISHVFTEAMGMPLMEYITMLRMNEAKKLLRSTQIPVSRIAMQLGFSSIRSFNRFFMGQLHTTPSQYRKNHRQ
jgi:transcriptional regulator GlxA family with amidase domain